MTTSLPSIYQTAKTNPVERRRIQAAVVDENREQVARFVEPRVPAKHRDEAEQVGLIGVLVALEKFEPTSGAEFWNHATPFIEQELELFFDAGLRWRKRKPCKPNAPLSENSAEREAFARAFASAPDLFTPAEREAAEAVFFKGHSVVSAGLHLGLCTATAADRIRRARRKLHAWLERQAS